MRNHTRRSLPISTRENLVSSNGIGIDSKRVRFFQRTLFGWYRKEGRHFLWRNNYCDEYQVVIAEVLLQRTQAERVETFLSDFLKSYPSWGTLAMASPDALEEILEPLGLWRRRAKALLSLAKAVVNGGGQLPSSRTELESLPAVGQYIANAIITMCQGGREPLLDTNMARVLERFFGPRKLADIRYDPYLQKISRLVLAEGDARVLNWAILDLAAILCTIRNPNCTSCPLKRKCSYTSVKDTHNTV